MNKRNRDMLKGKLNWVRFHVGGDNFETYSRAHQVPKEFFGIAVANIEKFNREKNGTSVGIGVVANQDNFDGIQNLPRLALEWGADFFQAKIDFERVGDFDYVQWWYETALPFFENEKKSLDGKVRIFTGAGLRCSEIPYCHAHHVITAITADGDVAFCKMKRDERQFALGNIHKQSLRNIMDSERHRRLARELTPMTCETYETFCPYRTTNFNMQDYMNGVEIPTPETLTHINFF